MKSLIASILATGANDSSKKALYGLKQAPRAWYDKLSAFLIKSGFTKGVVDPTLFTRKTGKHLLLVQIYVDDIIFASTNPKACKLFAFEMNSTFKMSMMGQMSFFLGLQVSQNPRGIFINQSKYAQEIFLKKFGFDSCTPIDTPMAERPNLDEDKGGKLIDPTRFRGMVGSLMTSNRPTQKPPVQQNKKPNVSVNLSTRTKPATESRKPMPKSHTRNHRILPSKSVNARRAADHNRKLNVVDHNQFVIRSLKSVNTKTPQAKHSVNHTKKVWKATRNHNVNTTKTAWRPTRKVVGSVKPQWKPTGRHFALYDNCPLTRIMEPIVEPLELTPSVSSSSKVTMISRFTDCKLSDRKAGSKGLSESDLRMLRKEMCTTRKLLIVVSPSDIWSRERALGNLILRCSIHTVIIDPHGIRGILQNISRDLEFEDDGFATRSLDWFHESFQGLYNMYYSQYGTNQTQSTSGGGSSSGVVDNHLDAHERKQNSSPLELPLDVEEGVFNDRGEQRRDYMMSSGAEDDQTGEGGSMSHGYTYY
ncbi:retrovirus-related pol polyprotein from transposon TNT 1-94 [Tanacetum coccineum]